MSTDSDMNFSGDAYFSDQNKVHIKKQSMHSTESINTNEEIGIRHDTSFSTSSFSDNSMTDS